ncbi:HNH endonuclease [Arthrobacter sp. lap29]|uniref:HNH endonuclease n=1 Tax=Arthrobacter sp. lap29 TaxID=3056122 RepID=UPI0028F722AE|nr:HNH endonuclease [Arthrobacter sp. lap29]
MSRIVEVTKYVAHYEAAWTDLRGVFTARDLLMMCEDPGAQFSIREIEWQKFASAVLSLIGTQSSEIVERRHDAIVGGHKITTTRIRRGQNAFRQALLKDYGAVCAFTGPAPVDVLDAAHLYSFAKEGKHHEHGGLLLRKDLHRLFDLGRLAVDPDSCKISVSDLGNYPDYARLSNESLHVKLKPAQIEWFRLHWNAHRA